MRACATLLILLLADAAKAAEPLTIAVASNFARSAAELAARFEDETGIAVRLSNGSTGKLYAQIVNGAPFDLYLAADAERPEKLEASGLAVSGSRFTYARGQLTLWSAKFDDCHEALRAGGWIALANPETAPYGRAAREYLQAAGYWDDVNERIAYGENVMQAMQFAATGNADAGLVARSVLDGSHTPDARCMWAVPGEFHEPIEQQAVLLARAKDDARALRLIEFLRSETALTIIEGHGYEALQ